MSRPTSLDAQRGATLIVGLIMLLLITLMVSSAFMLSTTNLKAVGNMQFRDEAVAAANVAVEDVLDSLLRKDPKDSKVQPPAQTIQVDINNDNTTDYVVSILAPACIRAARAPTPPDADSDTEHQFELLYFNTLWDINATVTDAASGASVRVRQGVRVSLTQTQCDTVCPPAPSIACS